MTEDLARRLAAADLHERATMAAELVPEYSDVLNEYTPVISIVLDGIAHDHTVDEIHDDLDRCRRPVLTYPDGRWGPPLWQQGLLGLSLREKRAGKALLGALREQSVVARGPTDYARAKTALIHDIAARSRRTDSASDAPSVSHAVSHRVGDRRGGAVVSDRIAWQAVIAHAATIVLSYDTDVTLRQLSYRLVAHQTLPNPSNAYKGLSRLTAEARRVGTFPALIDRGRVIHRYQTFRSPSEARRWLGRIYRRDRTEGQDVSLYVGVEKAGIVEQLTTWFGDLGGPDRRARRVQLTDVRRRSGRRRETPASTRGPRLCG